MKSGYAVHTSELPPLLRLIRRLPSERAWQQQRVAFARATSPIRRCCFSTSR